MMSVTIGRRLAAVLAAVALLACATDAATAQPKSELWPRWTAFDATSKAVIDHMPWQRWLGRNVVRGEDGVTRIAYGKIGAASRKALGAYLAQLSATPIDTFARAGQMAFWINLYNAATVKLVLDHYPFPGMLRLGISPGLFSIGPWGRKLIRIQGEELSLDDIEHRILRPIWRDPRIHYAVNCAAVGCPNLRREAFTGARVDAQLDDAAGDYINNWRGVAFEDGALMVSSLYKWYAEDFGGDEKSILAHLRRYARGDLARRLRTVEEIGFYRYDWDLNDLTAP
jgi:hypothetical protein